MTVLLSEQIRSYRTARKLTQTQLAQRLGVPETYISNWENGRRPRVDVVPEICRALGVSPNELFGWEQPGARN